MSQQGSQAHNKRGEMEKKRDGGGGEMEREIEWREGCGKRQRYTAANSDRL